MNINKNGFGSKYTNNSSSHGSALKRGGGSVNHNQPRKSGSPFNAHTSFTSQHGQSQNTFRKASRPQYDGPPSMGGSGSGGSNYNSARFNGAPHEYSRNVQSHPMDPYLERFRSIAEVLAVRKLDGITAMVGAGSSSLVPAVHQFERECAAPARTLLIKIVSSDLEYFQVHRCERIYWKFLCYGLLDKLDSVKNGTSHHPLTSTNEESLVARCVATFLADNDTFYQTLGHVLKSVYNFNAERYYQTGLGDNRMNTMANEPTNQSPSPPQANERIEKLCVFLAHWIAVARGDLARYGPSASPPDAAAWYNRAIQLYPKMGHAYNQMGVVSVTARKPLDALYYFTRSLAAPFPSESAHHSLQALFEDIRRRSIAFRHHAKLTPPDVTGQGNSQRPTTPKSSLAHAQPYKGQAVLERLLTKKKTEIWIRADQELDPSTQLSSMALKPPVRNYSPGLLATLGLGESEELALGTPAYDTLKRCFVLNYIHCHAKLYTRTDLETFDVIARDALNQFRALLSVGPSMVAKNTPPTTTNFFLTCTRLLQIFAINMFAIERCQAAATRSVACLDESHRPVVLEKALQLATEMFVAVAQTYTTLAAHQRPPHHQLLPCLRVWVDWMLGNTLIWNPLPAPLLDISDFGTTMAGFANRVMIGSLESLRVMERFRNGNRSSGPLIEDAMLRGFVPLMSAPQKMTNDFTSSAHRGMSEAERIDYETAVRLDKIKAFGDILMGLDPAVLDYDKSNRTYVSLIDVPHTPAEDEEIPTENLDELYTNEQMDSLVDLHETTLAALERRPQTKNTQLPELQAKMEDFRHKLKLTHSKHTIIEIRPRYLVSDTNCLIDHLVALEAIIKWNNDDPRKKSSHNGYHSNSPSNGALGAGGGPIRTLYTILIPLVVVSELEKLAAEQTTSNDSNPNQHPQYVTFQNHRSECAKAALRFINQNLPGSEGCQKNHPYYDGNQRKASSSTNTLFILTGRGNVLENLQYRTELSDSSDNDSEDLPEINERDRRRAPDKRRYAKNKPNRGYSTRNDDTILRGCLKLIEGAQRPNRQSSSGAHQQPFLAGLTTNSQLAANLLATNTVKIERDLVFFTDDQNLKIKAHTLMVPTCSVGHFMKWASIPF